MGKYFTQFYNIMNSYINNLPETKEEVYTNLFSWYLKKEGNTSISTSQLSKWTNGNRFVPNDILRRAFDSPDIVAKKYHEIFEFLFDESRVFPKPKALDNSIDNSKADNKVTSGAKNSTPMSQADKEKILALGKEYSDLGNELGIFLESFPYKLSFQNPDDFNTAAEALTTALVFEYLYSDNTLIDPVLYNPLRKKLKYCQEHEYYFSTMYVLAILLNSPNNLLGAMLKKCGNNLLDKWQSRAKSYDSKEIHHGRDRSQIQQNLCDVELVEIAKQLAYFKPLDQSRIAGEADFCRAIVLCHDSRSNTIRKFKADLGEMADFEKWNALAIECLSELQTSTID